MTNPNREKFTTALKAVEAERLAAAPASADLADQQAAFTEALRENLEKTLGVSLGIRQLEGAIIEASKATRGTPDAAWRFFGQPDPHLDRFNVERSRLPGGDLTDDQVAFQTAMICREEMMFEPKLSVARDRIRWLSRKLAEAVGSKTS